jgi:hypothetical protein
MPGYEIRSHRIHWASKVTQKKGPLTNQWQRMHVLGDIEKAELSAKRRMGLQDSDEESSSYDKQCQKGVRVSEGKARSGSEKKGSNRP